MTASVSPPLTATGDCCGESCAAPRAADAEAGRRFAALLSRRLANGHADAADTDTATATVTFAPASDAQSAQDVSDAALNTSNTPDASDASDASDSLYPNVDAAALAAHAPGSAPDAAARGDMDAALAAQEAENRTVARADAAHTPRAAAGEGAAGVAGRAAHGLDPAGFDGVDGIHGQAEGVAHAADDMLAHIRASRAASADATDRSGSARTARTARSAETSLNAAPGRGARAGNVAPAANTVNAARDADHLIPSAGAPGTDAGAALAWGQDGGAFTGHANLPGGFVTLAQTAATQTASLSVVPGTPGTLSAAAAQDIFLPLNHSQWPQALGQRVLYLSQADAHALQVAELRLNPAELGPLRIAIEMHNHVAHASFVSAHASVRQAVENALPQLQEQFAQAGISLGQTSVSDHSAPGHEAAATAFADMPAALVQHQTVQPAIPAPARHPSALIDTFA